MKKKRVLAFLLSLCMMTTLCGCTNIIDEQWEVVEKYRLENTTTQEAKKSEKETTQAPKVQNVLADFINEDAFTLGERIDVPNGYTRVDEKKSKKEKASNKNDKKSAVDTTNEETTTEFTQDTIGSDENSNTQGLVNSTEQSNMGIVTGSSDAQSSGDAASGDATTTQEEATTEERTNTTGVSYKMSQFMRTLPVKGVNDKLKAYTKEAVKDQDSYAAILNLGLDNKNLQQRASSMMRLYAEYYWTNQDYDNMKFKMGDGFELDYSKWVDGYRPYQSAGSWVWNTTTTQEAGDSYNTLQSYLEFYFGFSGMKTLLATSHNTSIETLQVGDYFVDENQENVAMVADVAKNKKGDICFLLATGGTPGQDIQILKNPAHEDPWYYVSECQDEIETPLFKLKKASCYHLTTSDCPDTGIASGDAVVSGDAAVSSEASKEE